MMNERGNFRSEAQAERPEEDSEDKERAEQAIERMKDLENAADSADQEIFDNVTKTIEEISAPGTPASRKIARSPEAREALQELEEMQIETSAKTDATRQRLRDLKAQLKRSAIGAGILLSVLGAELSSAKAEPGPPKGEPGASRLADAPSDAALEGVSFESGEDPRPPFELVKELTLEKIDNDRLLAAELGEENMKALREAVERFDADAVNAALAELAGMDPSRTAGETPYGINILSEAEFKEMQKKNRLLGDDASGWHVDDVIFVRPVKRLRNDGSLHAADMISTLTHEQIHAAYTEGTGDNFGRESGITGTVHEGTTEWLNTLVLVRLGVEGNRQAYGGGTVATAFMLEQVLGTEDLARLHLEGELDDLEDALMEKLGKDAADSIMSVAIDNPYYYDTGSGNAVPLLTALEIAQRAKISGMDVSELGDRTADYGLHERLMISEDANTVILTTESRQKGMYQTMIHDTDIRLTTHGFSMKICIDTFEPVGKSVHDTLYKMRLRSLRNISERVEQEYVDSHKETQRTPETDEDFKRYQNMRRSSFTLTIPAPERIWELQKEHGEAETDEQRRAIEDESTRVLQQAASDAEKEIRRKFRTLE